MLDVALCKRCVSSTKGPSSKHGKVRHAGEVVATQNNMASLTDAPVGTASVAGGTSSGIAGGQSLKLLLSGYTEGGGNLRKLCAAYDIQPPICFALLIVE
jgi:hypothetical protein